MERGDGGIQLRQVHVIDPDQKVKVRSGEAYVNKAYEGSEVLQKCAQYELQTVS
jgi:hypothetical protein